MKTTFSSSVLTFLLVTASSQCFAEMLVEKVSKERAKELGIEMYGWTANVQTNAAWIELEFKPEKFKEFNWVHLDIRDGEKFLMGLTQLKEHRTSSGNVVVDVLANRELLEKATLTIVTGHARSVLQRGDYGRHELRVKDFVDLKSLSDMPKKHAPASGAKDESKGLPASPR
jgi:hypothetical protein